MRELANKLMQQSAVAPGALSAIVGSTSTDIAQALADLNRPRLRIGLWPILHESLPEIAMGVATVLALLLERWQEIQVYRLFAKLEGDPEKYDWTIGLSQFRVDDWQLEGLDENVAVWGALAKDNEQWRLTLEVESDELLEEGEETGTLTYEAQSLSQLIEILPQAAAEIAGLIGADEDRGVNPAYTSAMADDETVGKLLGHLFQWELDLLFHLWGKRWSDEAVTASADTLLQTGRDCGDEFAAWVVPSAISRAMLPMFEPIHELLAPAAQEIATSISNSAIPAILLAPALFRSGSAEAAYNLLESSLETHPTSAELWLSLAELYWRGERINEAIDTFQRAIEQDCASATLFARYGDVMIALASQGWRVDEFILVDPGETAADLVTWEAIEAYEAALEMAPSNTNVLFRQVILLADTDDEDRL